MPQDYQRIRNLFDEAMDQPEAERRAWLERAAGGDADLFQAVWRLVEAEGASQSYFEREPPGPQRIDRYLISSKLGSGAMGVVFQAVDPLIGRTVAVKVIRMNVGADSRAADTMRDALFREARTAGVLAHPNIVTIYDVGTDNGSPFIAMEFVAGYSVQHLLEASRTVDSARAIPILKETASALDYAHSHGVIHRDVKPANLLLHKGSTVKITDFGIARVQNAQSHTATGVLMGTPNYMAPEQFQGKSLDGRADQFAVAAIAFEMLTGSRPFPADNLPSIMQLVLFARRPSALQLNPLLPRPVDAVLARGLAKEGRDRYDSCTQFVTELERALLSPAAVTPLKITPLAARPAYRALRLPAPDRPPASVPVAARRSSRLWLIRLGILLAAVLIFLLAVFLPVPKERARPAGSNQAAHPQTAPPAAPPPALAKNPPAVAAPSVDFFVAVPDFVKPGEPFHLIWSTANAPQVVIDPGVGPVAGSGSHSLIAASDTTFTLIAGSGAQTARATASIAVERSQGARPPATVSAADYYADGAAVWRKGQHAAAIPLFRASAGLGDRRAIAALADAYSRGDGVAVDPEEAARWYRKAADAGDAKAMDLLGESYAAGLGVPKDDSQAVYWYRRAVAANNPAALYDLATMYEAGRGIDKNTATALDLYRRAAVAGNPKAKAGFARLAAADLRK